MGKIFVSYRREDSADTTGRLCDRLAERFGAPTIFKDVDSIPIGSDYRTVLREAVETSNVVLVVIGRHWLHLSDISGQRRLDDPRDFVRIEVEAALARNVPVVPVLVQQATMPNESDLPSSMSAFVYRHGVDIRSDPHFNADVKQLIDQLAPFMVSPAEMADTTAVPTAESQTSTDTVTGKDFSRDPHGKSRVISLGAHLIRVEKFENLFTGYHIVLYYDDKQVAEDKFYLTTGPKTYSFDVTETGGSSHYTVQIDLLPLVLGHAMILNIKCNDVVVFAG